MRDALRQYLKAFGSDHSPKPDTRRVYDAEIRFAQQYLERLEAWSGAAIDRVDFLDLFEANLRMMCSHEGRTIIEEVPRATLLCITYALDGLMQIDRAEPEWSIDVLEQGDETRNGAVVLMIRQKILAEAVNMRLEPWENDAQASTFAKDIERRTMNRIVSRGITIATIDSATLLEAIDVAIDDVMRQMDEPDIRDRVASTLRVLGLEEGPDDHAGHAHEHDELAKRMDQDRDAVSIVASAIARDAATRGYDPDLTWNTVFGAIVTSMFSTHLGRPVFESIPEVAAVLEAEVDMIHDLDDEDRDEIDFDRSADHLGADDHSRIARYVIAVRIMNGSLQVDPDIRFEDQHDRLVEEIATMGMFHRIGGPDFVDPMLMSIEQSVEAVFEHDPLGDDPEFEPGYWREHGRDIFGDMDADTLDHVFTSGEMMPKPPMDEAIQILGAFAACTAPSEAAMRRLRTAASFLGDDVGEEPFPECILFAADDPARTTFKEASAAVKALATPTGVRYAAAMVQIRDQAMVLLHQNGRTSLISFDAHDFGFHRYDPGRVVLN